MKTEDINQTLKSNLHESLVGLENLANEYLSRHQDGGLHMNFDEQKAWANVFAWVCLDIDAFINGLDMDRSWLLKHAIKTPCPASTDRMTILNLKAADAINLIAHMNLEEEHLVEAGAGQKHTPLRGTLVALFWAMAIVVPHEDFLLQIQKFKTSRHQADPTLPLLRDDLLQNAIANVHCTNR